MPPKGSTSGPQPFKPLRPQASRGGSTSTGAQGRSKSGSTTKTRKVRSLSEDSSSEDSREGNGHHVDGLESEPATISTSLPNDKPVIPEKLLRFLLHENFKHDDTRITKEAMLLIEKYMEVFVREAVAQAMFERAQTDKDGGDGFLDVEDLEKIAPQLLLDF